MISIFQEAGYHVDGGYRDGVMRLAEDFERVNRSN